jgi:hypothetical protein
MTQAYHWLIKEKSEQLGTWPMGMVDLMSQFMQEFAEEYHRLERIKERRELAEAQR